MESRREGFALAATVMAMILVGALVTGGFFAASQEGNIALSTRFAEEAFTVAEAGLNKVAGSWMLSDYESIPVGSSTTVEMTIPISGGRSGKATVEVRRMATQLYFIESTGEVGRGGHPGARRQVALFSRTYSFDVSSNRAVQVYGSLTVGGNSKVVGYDSTNQKINNKDQCPEPDTTQIGVVAKDTSQVKVGGSAAIVGSPQKDQDTSLAPEDFTVFGDWTYEELAAMASKKLPDGTVINNTLPSLTTSGRCDTGDLYNWGAPRDSTHPCHTYMPIIHAQGDLTINSDAAGQGILLVDGNLRLAGGYEFNGIVIVKGKFETGSGSSRVYGTTLILSNAQIGKNFESDLLGTPIVNLSTCAVYRSVKYNTDISRAFPIAERSWFDLTAAGVGT